MVPEISRSSPNSCSRSSSADQPEGRQGLDRDRHVDHRLVGLGADHGRVDRPPGRGLHGGHVLAQERQRAPPQLVRSRRAAMAAPRYPRQAYRSRPRPEEPRLRVIAALVVSVFLLVLAAAPASAAPSAFRLGVAAGDVTSSSAIVWGKANRTGRVRLLVARDRELTTARRRFVLKARDTDDATVSDARARPGPGPALLVPVLPGPRPQPAGNLPHRPGAGPGSADRVRLDRRHRLQLGARAEPSPTGTTAGSSRR